MSAHVTDTAPATDQTNSARAQAAPRVAREIPLQRERGGSGVDAGLLLTTLLLMGFGTVMVYSASIGVADGRFGDANRFLRTHLIHIGVSLVALIVAATIPYTTYREHVYKILGFALLLLIMIALGLGITRGRSARWIGPRFLEFQPSELVKLAFVVYLAYSVEKKLERIKSFAIGFLPHLLVCGLIVVLCLAQPDLGTSLLLGTVMFSVLFVAGTRVSYIVGVLLLVLPGIAGYIQGSERRLARILTWLNPWEDRFDSGFQTVNALISLGSGGLTRRWGSSRRDGRTSSSRRSARSSGSLDAARSCWRSASSAGAVSGSRATRRTTSAATSRSVSPVSCASRR